MSFLDRIRECNSADLSRYRPFVVAGARVGWVGAEFAARLEPFARVFHANGAEIALDPALATFAARTEAVDEVMRALAAEGAISGWRDEPYAVATAFAAPPLLALERAAVPRLGVRAYGVHLNGYVREGGDLHMWIGRRARDKPTYPGMLDNMVAGGQPIGVALTDNLIKECAEEAAIPRALAARARPVGAVTYCAESEGGVKPDVQFCFDLELPANFSPRNTDGEIDEFHLWPIARVMETVAETREFKFNCNLVIIDFLLRHGLIPPDDPDYVEIARGLRA